MDKKFLKFVAVVFLFVLSLVCADQLFGKFCDYLWEKMPEGGERVAKSNYVVNKQESNVVITGSSRAQSHYNTIVLSDSLDTSIYNAGGDGQDLLYTFAIIRTIVLRQHPPKILIVDINPWDLYQNKTDLNLLYPHYRTHPEIREIIDENLPYACVKMKSGIYRYNTLFGRILRSILLPPDTHEVNGYGARSIRKWITGPFETKRFDGILSNYKTAKMEEILDVCEQKKISVVFVISPVYSDYGESLSNEALAAIAHRRHIPLIDCSRSIEFRQKAHLFYDYIHLNSIGADLFSSRLAEELKHILPPQDRDASPSR